MLTLCGNLSWASGSIFAPVDGMGCEQGGRNPKKEGEEQPVESEKVCSDASRIQLVAASNHADSVWRTTGQAPFDHRVAHAQLANQRSCHPSGKARLEALWS
jgi:hypothetical protein